jgi:hypothetical protein
MFFRTKIKRILEYVERHYLNNFHDKNILCMNESIIKITTFKQVSLINQSTHMMSLYS